ncbi:hypothetical protein SeMB42_g02971 [Synchytrium endobioticum]|uniref:Uncharacterized protein n=1 Tax=Synchytrium endobioticum TaxID=286115 RepID=A0A507DBT2_9FUNG|nr:hypothetical protein SeMB42_g02971 [Synchytrium endobioticum]TPX49044.1 hypothetical protein SeLEV6574_g01718 [Synchytrium endobioticum]
MLTVENDETIELQVMADANHKKILKDLIENDLPEEDDEADEDYHDMVAGEEEPEGQMEDDEDGEGQGEDDDDDEGVEANDDGHVDDDEVKELINEIVEKDEGAVPLLMEEAKVLRSGYEFGGEYRTVEMAEFASDDEDDEEYETEDDEEDEDEEMTDDVDADELKEVLNDAKNHEMPSFAKNVMALRTGKEIPSSAEVEDLAAIMEKTVKA